MSNNYKKLLLLISLICFYCTFNSVKSQSSHYSEAIKIANKNIHDNSTIKQLLVVYNEKKENSSAVLVALDKRKDKWQVKFEEIIVGVGHKGFADINKKREGDQLSPTGLFKLGILFTYLDKPRTKMPFIQATADDKWIDDPDSDDYNTHVRGSTNAKSYERMKLKSNAYKYCMVIEYNTNPVIKGHGSAIFIHLNRTPDEPTAGCVGICENEMEKIIKWMKPKHNPHIIMGNKNVLISGL